MAKEETLADKIGTTETEPAPDPAKDFDLKLNQLQDTVTQKLSRLEGVVDQLANNIYRQAPPTPTTTVVHDDGVTDEELSNAMMEGKPQALRKMLQSELGKFRREVVEPLREMGISSISSLSQTVTTRDLKHYKRYEKEIGQYLNTLPPEARMNPEMIKLAYTTVVGQHVDELTAEATEQAIRQASTTTTQDTAGTTRATSKGTQVPSAKERFGPEAVDALANIGKDEDAFARKLGYKSWEDYMQVTEKYAQ